jgi:hypothetical protein
MRREVQIMKTKLKIAISLLATASFVLAQDTAPQGGQAPGGQAQGGWRRVGDSGYGSGQAPAQAPVPVPAQLTLKAGTFISVRVNQSLSSDKSQVGDAFTGTLVRPIVVDGFVVAQAGQTLAGKVFDVKKAKQAAGMSHLGIQVTDLTLVDGQPAPVQTALIGRNGPPKEGGDSAATTTAAAGAGAPTIGVLETHDHATLITPESVLTFRIDSAVNIATANSPQAFRLAGPNDYNQPQLQAGRPGVRAVGFAGYPYGYPYAYGYPYYPYYWGPSIGIGFGGFYGGGFRGRFR